MLAVNRQAAGSNPAREANLRFLSHLDVARTLSSLPKDCQVHCRALRRHWKESIDIVCDLLEPRFWTVRSVTFVRRPDRDKKSSPRLKRADTAAHYRGRRCDGSDASWRQCAGLFHDS